MIEKQIKTEVYGKPSSFSLRFYTEEDIPWLKNTFDAWRLLHQCLREEAAGDQGLSHDERATNIPEAISEAMYCTITTAGRYCKSPNQKVEDSSFDAFDIIENKTVQIKATQMEYDCTSFGPNTKQDKIIFMDFYNGGNLDGTVDIYEIPYDLLKDVVVKKNGNVTFEQRKEEGKRPRLSLKRSVIIPNDLQPLYKSLRLW